MIEEKVNSIMVGYMINTLLMVVILLILLIWINSNRNTLLLLLLTNLYPYLPLPEKSTFTNLFKSTNESVERKKINKEGMNKLIKQLLKPALDYTEG